MDKKYIVSFFLRNNGCKRNRTPGVFYRTHHLLLIIFLNERDTRSVLFLSYRVGKEFELRYFTQTWQPWSDSLSVKAPGLLFRLLTPEPSESAIGRSFNVNVQNLNVWWTTAWPRITASVFRASPSITGPWDRPLSGRIKVTESTNIQSALFL